jgi:hypothetical protein
MLTFHLFVRSGGRIRTCDLRVMSPFRPFLLVRSECCGIPVNTGDFEIRVLARVVSNPARPAAFV